MTKAKAQSKGETPLRNIRVGDLWDDAILVSREIGTSNTAVCIAALQRHVDENQSALRRAKRRRAREARSA